MASEVVSGRPGLSRLKTQRTGAVAQDVSFTFDADSDPAYGAFIGDRGFDAVQVMSPIAAAGAADLEVQIGSSLYFIAGGGNTQTLPGPVRTMRITPRNAAIGGTGSDQAVITPLSRLRTGAM